ncbi:MAG: LLM class flavin-dependent oxidoreductase [Reyranellaceae bacterium]
MPRPSRAERQLRLGVFVQAPGHHVGGWRHRDAVSSGWPNLGLMQSIAATAERGRFDLFFLGDGFATGYDEHPATIGKFEPLTLLAALAMGTSRIGLAATASTTYGEPYHVARAFASLDHLSAGRAAWNVVTTAYDKSAAVFGRAHPPHAERYAIAEEFVTACRLLWDSWDDDAFVGDKAGGRFVRPGSLHPPRFAGRYLSVQGALNVPRPPQGHPVLIQAGSSGPGQALAARIADVVFTAQNDMVEATAFRRDLRAQAAQAGRRPDRVLVMPGVMPVVGRTRQEAESMLAEHGALMDPLQALTVLSERLGADLSAYPLDGPVPDLPDTEHLKSRAALLLHTARRDHLTLRQLGNRVAAARGHLLLVDTPDAIAATLARWFEAGAADGFNVMPPFFPGQFEAFVDGVVPRLQARGLFRTDYAGSTLREHLGLPRPARSDDPGKSGSCASSPDA